ncbi:MAG: hypothetical protein GXP26_10885 [Planctomycetes bacterium]|nr:hypothetical protein [Planctomycetota bacterium]
MNHLRTNLRFFLLTWLLATMPLSLHAENDTSDRQTQRIRKIILSRGDSPTALAHLIQLTKDLEPPAAAQLFRQLADDYLRVGQYDQAGNMLQQLALQYPEQPAATDGLITSILLYSSSEVSRTQRTSTISKDKKSFAIYALHLAQQALRRDSSGQRSLNNQTVLGSAAKQQDLASNPALAFQCAVAARLSGNPKSALSWLTPLKHNTRMQPWNHRAQTENWLLGNRKDSSPKQTLACPQATERPHLDGLLDDPLWKSASTTLLASPQQNPPTAASTQVQLTHDAKFLYLAIRCTKLPNVAYLSDNRPRTHDADLAKHDHVHIQLDLDRDYATTFQLSIDHRGQTADTCWLDASWNPRWYVAAHQDESHWTIEAAIPWQELTRTPPQPGEAWTLAIKRRAPNTPTQTWPTPPAPDTFGLLTFE